MSRRITMWMAEQKWRDSDGNPFVIASHQFRPTLAGQVMGEPWMNEYALMDHFKHHDLWMTDGYVGCRAALHRAILRKFPGASKATWEAQRRRELGMGDDE